MDVSIVICTYNRAESLRRTLEGFRELIAPSSAQWELVVVDNNSRDGTRSVCDSFTPPFPFRYIFEPRQGKSCALNRALAETTAPLLVFTDDDVDVDKNWLVNLLDAVRRHPEADFFGGKIFPRWERKPPRWLEEHANGLLNCVMVSYDRGDREYFFSWDELLPFGANLLIRRSVFDKGFAFNEEMGLKGKDPARGEETELMDRLIAKGHKGLFVPTAIVHHRNAPHRMREKYVREWYKGDGMVHVRRGEVEMKALLCGAPRWLYRQLIQTAFGYALTRWTRPSDVWLRYEMRMASTWGMICESRRRTR